MCLADAVERLDEAAVPLDVEVALAVGAEIGRAMVGDTHVGVPLDVVEAGVGGDDVVDHFYDMILHGGIGHVEHELCAAAAGDRLAIGAAHNPVGVFLVKLALGVGHLRLDPYTEADTLGCGVVDQGGCARGELGGVYRPVAQRGGVVVAGVFATKPSVVHHK